MWLLAALLVASETIYIAMLRLDAANGARPVLTFLAMMGALFALYAAGYLIVRVKRHHGRGALFVIAVGAVLFRMTLLPAGLPHDAGWKSMLGDLRADLGGESLAYERFLLFDSDIWRYLWDGHVFAHGINPYRYAPADPKLDALGDEENPNLTDGRAVWSDIRENIGYAEMPTIYPPLAQGVFWLSHRIAPGSVLVMKGMVVVFDLLAGLFIALTLGALGRPRSLALAYAWNPLVIKVFSGSGHIDAALVAALAATVYFLVRGSRGIAAVAFGAAVLTKLSPLVLLPFIARRAGWRKTALAGALVLAGYLPFLVRGKSLFEGLLAFAREWRFNAGPFALFEWGASAFSASADGLVARVASGLIFLALIGWLAWNDDGRGETFARYGAAALGALLVLSPAVMPWYSTWVLPLALIANQRVWFYFSALVCLAFLVMVRGTEFASALWLEYGTLAVLIWMEFRRARKLATVSAVAVTTRAGSGWVR